MRRAQKRIILYLVLPALSVYIGLRFYAQYRHVDIYVSRVTPMPPELASRLPVEEMKMDRVVTVESPYANAPDKILTRSEVRHLRSAIAWHGAMPAFIDSLTIQSPTRALARRTTSRVMLEYQIVRRGDRWLIESATRSELGRYPAQRD